MATPTQSAVRAARRLEATTVAWNSVEAAVAVVSGILAGSVALTGFGLDSAIEATSAVIVLWKLTRVIEARAGADNQRSERVARALRAIAVTFFALALYLVVEGVDSLVTASRPDSSPAGVAISAAALLVMPALAAAKYRVGRRIEGRLSALVLADAAETRLCAVLALSTLCGLLAYSVAGWWWADPGAGFVVAAFAVREGAEIWQGEEEEEEEDGCDD